MASTNFVPGTTIASTWLNDVNRVVYNPDGSGFVGYVPEGVGAVNQTVQDKLRQTASILDFGAKADGVTDDTVAIKAAFDSIKTTGGVLEFPEGTILAFPYIMDGSTLPVTIKGAGKGKTILKKNSNGTASGFSVQNSSNLSIRDISFDVSAPTFTGAIHGVRIVDCNDIELVNVSAYGFTQTGLISFTATNVHNNNITYLNCDVDGNNQVGNGISIVAATNSGMTNCRAINIGKTGSPGYALQLKDNCIGCWIQGGYAENAISGIAFGQELVDGQMGVTGCSVSGVLIRKCFQPIVMGRAYSNNLSDINIEMDPVDFGAGLRAAVFMSKSYLNSVSGLNIGGVVGTNFLIMRTSESSSNITEVLCLDNTGGATRFLRTEDTSSENLLKIGVVQGFSEAITGVMHTELSSSKTNQISIGEIYTSATTISSDRLSVTQNLTYSQIDTEGAAATDNLAFIDGGVPGQRIALSSVSSSRKPTIVSSTDPTIANCIQLNGGTNFLLSNPRMAIMLLFVPVGPGIWIEIGRSTAGA